jgi:hypothetical protein
MRYDRETLRSKIEREGDEGIARFEPSEVPEELEELWSKALEARVLFEGLMEQLMDELEVVRWL